LRVSEATGADIDRLGLERGHRTLTILRKGGKIVTIPLAPRTAMAIDLAIGERPDGPIFLGPDVRTTMRDDRARVTLDRQVAYIVAALPRRRRPPTSHRRLGTTRPAVPDRQTAGMCQLELARLRA